MSFLYPVFYVGGLSASWQVGAHDMQSDTGQNVRYPMFSGRASEPKALTILLWSNSLEMNVYSCLILLRISRTDLSARTVSHLY